MVASGAHPGFRPVEDFQPRARQLTPSAVGRPCASEEGFVLAAQAVRRRQTDPVPSRASRAAVARHGPGRAVVRRAVVGGLRDRGDPARPDPRRRRRRSASPVRSRSSSPRSSRSSSSRTGRRFTPTRAAAAPTSSRRRTSARRRRSIAAAALLIDYVLTVAVSIAAGVAAITSAFPQWHIDRSS